MLKIHVFSNLQYKVGVLDFRKFQKILCTILEFLLAVGQPLPREQSNIFYNDAGAGSLGFYHAKTGSAGAGQKEEVLIGDSVKNVMCYKQEQPAKPKTLRRTR